MRGRERVWDFLVAADEPWEPGAYELDEVSDGGDHVAARMRRDLRGKSSGVEVEYPRPSVRRSLCCRTRPDEVEGVLVERQQPARCDAFLANLVKADS
jgi:hypothetical protein